MAAHGNENEQDSTTEIATQMQTEEKTSPTQTVKNSDPRPTLPKDAPDSVEEISASNDTPVELTETPAKESDESNPTEETPAISPNSASAELTETDIDNLGADEVDNDESDNPTTTDNRESYLDVVTGEEREPQL